MMVGGAWGRRAGDLLERAAERHGAEVHRAGNLTMPAAPHLHAGLWACWLFGEPTFSYDLAPRLRVETSGDLLGAFGAALAELGEQACELLVGRFVVVVLNHERDRCVVARDQLGAQPLVYAPVADGGLFAEHERELLDLLPSTPAPDRLALLQWVENGVMPPGRTLYEGVHRLAAGHRLSLSGIAMDVESWWTLRYAGATDQSASGLAERVRETAFAAVARAASGSERPAVKLSGGMDSACVAAGLAADRSSSRRAIAIGGTFAGHPATDESDLMEATARHTNLPLEQIAIPANGSILAPALEHIARWRLPPATPNLFISQPLAARARELGVDLMLDGEGGDELFGLAPYLIADMLRSGRLRTAWRLAGRIPGLGLDPSRRIRLRVVRHYGLRALAPTVARYRERRRLMTSPTTTTPRSDAQALAELCRSRKQDEREGPLWWRYLAKSLIDDRDALGVGAHFRREAADEGLARRHPFLYDLPLTEAMLRVPPQSQFDPVRDRPLLRDALTGLIPETVRTRHMKSYFTSLVVAGIRADESGLIDPLRRRDAPIRAYVATEALDAKLATAASDRPALGAGSLWQIAIANRWLAFQAGERF